MKHTLNLFFTLVLSTFCIALNGQSLEVYSIIDLKLDHHDDIAILLDLGIAADHVHHGDDDTVELFISAKEKAILDQNGFDYNMVIADTKAHADKQATKAVKANYKNQTCGLNDFALGKMGGYLVYEEVVERLKKIVEAYPAIAQTTVLGTSYLGNEIIALKISDNVAENEQLWEGSAYYDALTHAREPLSMMSTLYYIEWLLENYDNPNTIAKYLVDNRELHFVLIVNPDGYLHNESIAPNGGGGWRKNRKEILDVECIGIDLNRNFGTKYRGVPGTYSDEPCSATYRGPRGASEIETKLIQEYIDFVQPASAFSSHSYSDVMIDPSSVIDPSGYPDYDFDIYSKYASEFTPEAYHGYGPAFNLIGYEASGTTLAYLYEAGAIAWTPEIGYQFYEPSQNICDIVVEMLEPMKFISKIAGPLPAYHHHYLADDAFVIDGETIELVVGIKNKGLRESNSTFNATLTTNSSGVSIINPNYDFTPSREHVVKYNEADPFFIYLEGIDAEAPIEFELKIFDGEALIDASVFEIIPGSQKTIFREDFESGLGRWKQSNDLARWTLSETDAKSGKFTLVDSKEYQNNTGRSAVGLIEPIDLTGAIRPYLFFSLKHSYSPQEGSASIYVSESDDVVEFKGENKILKTYRGHSYWREEAIDLTNLAETAGQVYIKFLAQISSSRITDGLYVDDIKIIDLGLDQTTTTTNIDSTDPQIKVYPNPTYNSIKIIAETFESQMTEFEIYNSLGQVVSHQNFEGPMASIVVDLQNEPSGNYFVKTHSTIGVSLKKIVKL